MKFWIARNAENGTLELHQRKPSISKVTGKPVWVNGSFVGFIFDDLFTEVTFENSPQKVEIKLASKGSDRGKRDSIVRGLKQLEHDYMLSYEEEIDWLNKLVEK